MKNIKVSRKGRAKLKFDRKGEEDTISKTEKKNI